MDNSLVPGCLICLPLLPALHTRPAHAAFYHLHLYYKNQQKEMRVSAQSKAAKAFVDAMAALEPDDVESSTSDSQPISDGRRQDGKAKGGRRDTTEAKANPASRTRKATAKRRASADAGAAAVAEVSWNEEEEEVSVIFGD